VSEPITGSEDRRSSEREDALFRDRDQLGDPVPPASEPTMPPPPQPPAPGVAASPASVPPSPRENDLAERVAAIDRRTIALQSRLEEVARALGLLGRRLQEQAVAGPAVETPPAPPVDDARLRSLEEAVRRLASPQDLARLVDDAVVRATGSLTTGLESVTSMQERELALIDGLSAALDAEGAGLRMDQERVTAMIASLRDDLADSELARSGVTSTAAWSDVVSRVERALTAQANRIEAVLATVRSAVTEQLERHHQDVAGVTAEIATEVARTRDLTADRVQMATLAIDESTARVSAQLASGETAMSDQLDAVRSAVASVTTPLAELERRTDDLATAVETSAGELATTRARFDTIDASMQTVAEAVATYEEVIAQRLQQAASDALAGTAQEVSTAREAVERAGHTAAEELRQALAEVRAELESAVREAREAATDRAQQTLDAAAGRLRDATDEAGRTAQRLEAFEEVLAAVLAEHDQALADQRAQLVYDLVASLADNLSKRERKRLASKIEIPPTPQTSDMSRRIREVFELAADRDLTGLPREEPPVEEDASQPPPRPRKVVGSPLAEIIEEFDDDLGDGIHEDLEPPIGPDPTFEALLEQVRGLPETTRGRLVDAFGSLDALQAADDDTVMSVRGVGPALLERLRALSD
jgi:hypothetical protein